MNAGQLRPRPVARSSISETGQCSRSSASNAAHSSCLVQPISLRSRTAPKASPSTTGAMPATAASGCQPHATPTPARTIRLSAPPPERTPLTLSPHRPPAAGPPSSSAAQQQLDPRPVPRPHRKPAPRQTLVPRPAHEPHQGGTPRRALDPRPAAGAHRARVPCRAFGPGRQPRDRDGSERGGDAAARPAAARSSAEALIVYWWAKLVAMPCSVDS